MICQDSILQHPIINGAPHCCFSTPTTLSSSSGPAPRAPPACDASSTTLRRPRGSSSTLGRTPSCPCTWMPSCWIRRGEGGSRVCHRGFPPVLPGAVPVLGEAQVHELSADDRQGGQIPVGLAGMPPLARQQAGPHQCHAGRYPHLCYGIDDAAPAVTKPSMGSTGHFSRTLPRGPLESSA